MAKYGYTSASDAPVRIELTVHEMRTICKILQSHIVTKGEYRFYAQELHGQMVGFIETAAGSLRLEGDYLTGYAVKQIREELDEAVRLNDES